MGFGPRHDVEGERQKPVTREDRGRVVEGLVHGRLATPQLVVVHGRQVVVHQRIAMDAFERGTRHQGMLARNPEQRRALHHQEGPEPLAGTQARIAHGIEQPRRPRSSSPAGSDASSRSSTTSVSFAT